MFIIHIYVRVCDILALSDKIWCHEWQLSQLNDPTRFDTTVCSVITMFDSGNTVVYSRLFTILDFYVKLYSSFLLRVDRYNNCNYICVCIFIMCTAVDNIYYSMFLTSSRMQQLQIIFHLIKLLYCCTVLGKDLYFTLLVELDRTMYFLSLMNVTYQGNLILCQHPSPFSRLKNVSQ